MMWEVAAEKVTAAGATLEFDRRVDADRATTATARARSSRSTPAGNEHVYPCTHVISSMPLGALCQAMEPPVDTPTADAAAELRLPRPPHGRARRHPAALVPRQLDLRARPRRRGRPGPELRVVVAVHGEGRQDLPRPRVLRERGRRDVDQGRRRAHRAGHPRAACTSASSTTRRRSRPATSCACRRRIPCTTSTTRSTSPRCASGSTANTPNVYPVRPQRHAQVQQPGPLDAHRDALGREHPRAPTTTCGR